MTSETRDTTDTTDEEQTRDRSATHGVNGTPTEPHESDDTGTSNPDDSDPKRLDDADAKASSHPDNATSNPAPHDPRDPDRFAGGGTLTTLAEHYDPGRVEDRIHDHWESVDAYEYVRSKRSDGEPFYFVDGPPFTTGKMHVGNAWGKLLKDTLLRYHRMQGADVRARPGYDTHGLPVEVKVEQRNDFETKRDVEEYGLDAFVEECQGYATNQVDRMNTEFEDLGVWMDFDDPYATYDPDYVETVWSAFAAVHDRGHVTREERVVNTCPRCETALADSELEYETRSTTAAYVGFPLVDEDAVLLAWTTTPWTVVANEFVAVDADAEYARVVLERSPGSEDHQEGSRGSEDHQQRNADTAVYVASDCVDDDVDSLDVPGYRVTDRVQGEDLVGKRYDHPLVDDLPAHPLKSRNATNTPEDLSGQTPADARSEGADDGDDQDRPEDPHVTTGSGPSEPSRPTDVKPPEDDNVATVVHADYVECEKTGVVHSAPGLGHEDFERGQELDLPVFSPVAEDGTFTEGAGPYAGSPVREASNRVLEDLAARGALYGTEEYAHEYPECPRCDEDVVYRASEQWLVTVTDQKDRLHDALDDVEYHPEGARDERLRSVLEDAPDWNVSRQRYWGTPLPVWECDDCESEVVVGSREDLASHVQDGDVPEDLHRPAVDDLVLTCENCGGDAYRVEDVLDVWFDSAVASWASLDSLPGKTPTPEPWPADLVVEGQDQTRGWFLMQLYLGVLLAEECAYEEVLMHGFATLDGEPMSKSRGHVLRPETVVEQYGRDALRVHLLSHDQQERDVNLSGDLSGVETVRDELDVVWNTVRFATMYMDEDDHDPELSLGKQELQQPPESSETPDDGVRSGPARDDPFRRSVDRWVLDRLDATVETVTTAMEQRRPNDALSALLSFLVEDVSRYYVQSVRQRAWKQGDDPSKQALYDVLGTVLHGATRLLAPFAPFLAERLYDALGGKEPTVHATDWPEPLGCRGPDLERRFELLRSVEGAADTARQRTGRKKRWPVAEVVFEADEVGAVQSAVDEHRSHLRERLNAKSVRVTDEFDATERRVVPEMSELGPAFGETAPAVADAVAGMDPADLPLKLSLGDGGEDSSVATTDDALDDDGPVTVTRDMVTVETAVPDGYEREAFDGGTVYLDATSTPELEREGLARDVVRRVQRLRGTADLDLTDPVRLSVNAESARVVETLEDYRNELRSEVRAVELVDERLEHATTFDLDGGTVEVSLEPVEDR